MQTTYRRPGLRTGLGAVSALLVLLAGSGGVASATEPVRLAKLAEAAPLERGAGFGSPVEARRVRLVQRVLRRDGWAPGRVDGLFGPRTEAAVLRFQAAGGLPVDGVVGKQTAKALSQARSGLRRGAGYQKANGSRRVRSLQRRLARAGLNPGPLDGRFGPLTEAAVARLQHAADLNASGAVDGRTRPVVARVPRSREGARPVAAGLNTIRPQVLGSVAIRPLARPTAQTTQGADVWLAVAIAAAALLAGLLSGGLWTRTRSRPAAGGASGSVPEPRNDQSQAQPPEQQARRVDPVPPEPVVSEPGRRESLSAVDSSGVLSANGQNAHPLEPRDDQPRQLQAHPEPLPPQHGLAVGQTRRPEVRPEPRLAVAEPEPVVGPEPEGPVRAVGYVSVPHAHDRDGGVLEAQADAIAGLCARRGWELLHVVRDTENGHPKGMERPGLLYALERIAQGEASCLVVSELERLSRSAADLGRIVDWIDHRDGRLVAIDLRLDTGSVQGRLTARALVAVGQWEGRRIAEQTKKGLAAARARRATTGRPAVEDIPALKDRIVAMRQDGMTLQAIADRLNTDNTPTLRGGTQWRPSSVQAAAGYRRPKNRHTNPERHPNHQP